MSSVFVRGSRRVASFWRARTTCRLPPDTIKFPEADHSNACDPRPQGPHLALQDSPTLDVDPGARCHWVIHCPGQTDQASRTHPSSTSGAPRSRLQSAHVTRSNACRTLRRASPIARARSLVFQLAGIAFPVPSGAAGSSINDHLVGALGHLSVYIGPRGALISILLYWVNSSKSPRPTAVEIACMSRDNGLSVVRRGTKLRINSRARSMGLEERSGRR